MLYKIKLVVYSKLTDPTLNYKYSRKYNFRNEKLAGLVVGRTEVVHLLVFLLVH